MTIDERLVALRQSLELFASNTQSSFENMTKRMDERDAKLDAMLERSAFNQDRLEGIVERLAEHMDLMMKRMGHKTSSGSIGSIPKA